MADSKSTNTFRPKHKLSKDSAQYQLYKTARKWKSLGIGATLYDAVKLPPDVKIEDWVSVHGKECGKYLCLTSAVVDFYNTVNLLYGSVTAFCSPETCPVMSAGEKYVELIPL